MFVTNLHCGSCVSHAEETISPLRGVYKIDVSLLNHNISVEHEPGLTGTITDTLLDAAFEVRHVTTSDYMGRVVGSRDLKPGFDNTHSRFRIPFFLSNSQKKHIANCKSCQSQGLGKGTPEWFSSSMKKRKRSPSHHDEPSRLEEGQAPTTQLDGTEKAPVSTSNSINQYQATISIVGMTCASCTNSISNELEQLDFIEDVKINLLSNNAVVIFHGGASDASKIVEAIEDVGFEEIGRAHV